jgi:hypothetical protein
MLDERYEKFVRQLLQKTRQFEVNWQPSTDTQTFIVTEDDITIGIYLGSDDFDNTYVTLSLRNSDGKLIDNVTVDAGEKEYSALYDLFAEARRKANKVDATLDNLLKKLSAEGEFGDDLPF